MTAIAPADLRILAVDGGQSGIRLHHSAQETPIETRGVSRTEGSDDELVAALTAAWRSAGSPPVDRAVLGMTTAPSDAARSRALAGRIGAELGAAEVWLCDDSVTSHTGALSLGWGVSLVAGTGVACLAMPAEGEPRAIGGHGFLLGDEGGAFWIGREGLRAALRATEDRGAPTTLTEAAGRRFGPLESLAVRVHDDPRPVNEIAQFAADVLAATDLDPVAAAIVAQATNELHGVIVAAVRGAVHGSERVPIGLGGRLLAEPTPVRDALDARLAGDRTIAPRTADRSPLDGAMLLGRQATPGRYSPLVHVWRRDDAS
ncbi:MAG TPA: BadF/BadG/BcrA/BcrD ATPase family protein [Candidatus Limnocylindrales bacterium]|nr:BadF/BadG/BcrA/BcrD ATPase family protein [Candidatus Limnocylindrales bacterium]